MKRILTLTLGAALALCLLAPLPQAHAQEEVPPATEETVPPETAGVWSGYAYDGLTDIIVPENVD